MVMALDAKLHFRVVVGGSVRIGLARQGKNHPGIFFADWRQVVAAVAAGDFDTRPLAPEIDSSRGFDHLADIGSAYAGGAFEKIKFSVGVRVNELSVRDAAHQPQSRNQIAIDRT